MGEIAIKPIHNVHKKYRQMNLVNPYIFAPPAPVYNTEIGGVASTISTASALATKLGISVGAISNFTIVGSDVKCRITGSYAIPVGAFEINNSITRFYDQDGLVTSLGNRSFNNYLLTSLLKEVYLPNVTNVAQQVFVGIKNCVIYLPNVTAMGVVGYNDVFASTQGSIIYTNTYLQTSESGGVDADLVYAISQGATVRYVTNFTAPNPVITLSVGTIYNTAIQLNFTPPISTNTIEYYELYSNGVFLKNITASGQYITGLTANTAYNITLIAVDMFYNKSVVSNILNVSTTNTYLDADANAYMIASNNGQWQPEINTLFTSLKSNSLYTKLQAFYPFLGTTAAQHKFNGKNPLDTNVAFRLAFSGAGTFSNLGYTPNGTTGYANTYFAPSANQNVNNNGFTLVCGTNNSAAGGDVVEIGSFNSASQKSYLVTKNNNSNYAKVVGLNSTNITITGTNESRGIFTGTKQSPTVTDFFINGTQVGTVNSGGTLPTVYCYIGAMNLNGSPYGYSNQRIQFTAIHEGLTDAEVATFHSIIDTFENALGRKTW
jgi:hypothetical protein